MPRTKLRFDPGRVSLRLPKETFEAIDRLRVLRPGNIARNTWIAEAIQEKIERDGGAGQTPTQGEEQRG